MKLLSQKWQPTLALPLMGILVISMIASSFTMAYANTGYEASRAVKISNVLEGVRGQFTVKSISLTNDHRDYFVYLNFDQESSSIGSGYFVNLQNGQPTYWGLIYSSIQGGFVTHDVYTTMPTGTSFLADVVETSNGSNSFKATTYNGGTRTFTLKPTTTSATIAGVVARATKDYSSTNTMSGFVDALGDMYWSGTSKVWKYFTDPNTNESKCYSTDKSTTNSYIEQELAHLAPGGQASDKFDRLGFGPTLYTTDSCTDDRDSPVWLPYGSS